MIEKTDKEVKFNGKEYLDYIKYKDKNKYKLTNKTKQIIITSIISISVIIIIALIIDSLTPSPTPIKWTWEGILMFLSVCVGLSWLLHGVGFIIIKR